MKLKRRAVFTTHNPTAIEVAIFIVMETQIASMKKLPSNDVTIQADHKFGTYQIESTDSRSRTSPWVKASATSVAIIIVIKTAVQQKENSVRNVKKYNHFARLCKSVHAMNVSNEYANTYAHDENNVDSCSSDEFVIDNISAFSNVSDITCSNDQAFCIVKVHTFTKPKSNC